MKLYIINNSENGMKNIDGTYYLISEEGEALYSHWCSNKGWAQHDLIDQEWRKDRYQDCLDKYGKFEVLFLGNDDMTLEEIIKRNKELTDKNNILSDEEE